jgi:hypothetical protein
LSGRIQESTIPHEPDVFSKNTEVFEFVIDQGNKGQIKPATDVSLWEQAMMLVLLQREWSDNAVSNTLYFRPKWNLIKDINIGEVFYEDAIDPNTVETVAKIVNLTWNQILDEQEYEDSSTKVKLEQDQYTNDWHLKIWKFDPNHEEDIIEHVLASIAPLIKSLSVSPHSTVGIYRQTPEEGLTKEEYENRLASMKLIDWSQYRGSDGIDEKYCEGDKCVINQL